MLRICVLGLICLLLGVSCSDSEDVKSPLSEMISFSIKELDVDFSIGSDNYIETMVDDEVNLSSLTAVFQVSEKAKVYVGKTIQTSSYTKNDFSKNVNYTVEAEDGSTSEYTVVISKDSKILTFQIKELPETSFSINELSISADVLNGTGLSLLTAEFNISENSQLFVDGIEQESGKSQNDFTSAVTYHLIGSGGIEKDYVVTITELDNQAPKANAGDDKVIVVEQSTNKALVELDASLSSDLEGEIADYAWIENGQTIANGELVEIEFDLGIHNLTLEVTDQKGLKDTDDLTIDIREAGNYQPVDPDANQEVINLLKNLGKIANSNQFIFGQEFPLSFQLGSIRHDLSTSDCFDVTGDHPGVYGIDPHYMLYKTDQERQTHISEAKHAYENGSVVTFDFHQQSRSDNKIYYSDITTASDKELLYDIVNDQNGAREWFNGELDEVLDIINNELGFPVVFRLFHEMDGDWFWWGTKTKNHSAELYIEFYQIAADYIKERTNWVLFAWSPNGQLNESYYPGDNYVDLVGFDIYEPNKNDLKSKLISLSSFAYEHNKVAILAETGNRNNYISNDPDFWTSNILDAIVEGANEIRIAWVLAWFNAPWKSAQEDLFIPNGSSPEAAKEDFIQFKNNTHTLFQEETKALKVYE
ncbi:glycosyl hydrolase [Marinifilum caeruleilacunae]|uniref:GH26 domain-containing protein n=1 Tax=Marinifilum caeruleilacunae TaxID=2499076 RepID=A0ABX1WUU7_9BACT|nr:glycosyl hydrolase [Marinifilum caeruleilacunae]NOU59693.1 hypothetical protein [Marinifilum caeruleilacunae]